TILARDYELGIAQRKPAGANFCFRTVRPARMRFPDALNSFGRGGLKGFEEVFGLILELLEIRSQRKRLCHITFLLWPVVHWQAASRLFLPYSWPGGLSPS